MRSVVPLQPPPLQDLYPTTDHSNRRFRLRLRHSTAERGALEVDASWARHTTVGGWQRGAGSGLSDGLRRHRRLTDTLRSFEVQPVYWIADRIGM